MLTAMNSARGWQPVFFVKKDLLIGLALAPNMCPDQSQAFEEVNNSQAFSVGRKHFFPIFFFSERAASRFSKACLLNEPFPGMFEQSFAQIFEEQNWLRRTNIQLYFEVLFKGPRRPYCNPISYGIFFIFLKKNVFSATDILFPV